MCGRYASFRGPEAVRALFRTTNPLPDFQPTWNLAPSQPAMVVRRHPETGQRHLDLLQWGLIPNWSKDLKAERKPINARAETVATSPIFRPAFRARRALVPADVFYDWQTTGGPGSKQPYAFRRKDDQPIVFAGLWESRMAEAGKIIRTFAIITTEANADVAPLHDRMPAILEPTDWPVWLGEEPGDQAVLLHPAPDGLLEMWPIGRAVNSPRNNGPELLEQVGL
jgi:putative SOS response-associated peptidase YedK